MSRNTSFRTKNRSQRGDRSRRQNRGRSATNGAARGSSTSNGSDGGWRRHGTALPSWTDLEPKNRRRTTAGDSFLEEVSTGRFAVVLFAIAAAFTLYVGHVHATTDLLNRLQEVRTENRRLHLKHNRLKGQFDRQTGPSVIYERAREMGLRATVRHGPPVQVE